MTERNISFPVKTAQLFIQHLPRAIALENYPSQMFEKDSSTIMRPVAVITYGI